MPRSSRLFLFPDVNLWVALSFDGHEHYSVANQWLSSLDFGSRLFFCRVTQLSYLRLLTTEAVMGREGVLSQAEAWKAYDRWLENDRVEFLDEPTGIESTFRSLANRPHPAPRDWADAYLAAFASTADLTLVSFDQGFRGKLKNLQLLSI